MPATESLCEAPHKDVWSVDHTRIVLKLCYSQQARSYYTALDWHVILDHDKT